MASNRIIQSDNAVVDYTTITALINAVNDLQIQVDSINNATTHTSTTVNAAGQTVTSPTGQQIVRSGYEPFVANQSYVDITYQGFAKAPNVVAMCSDTSGKARTAYLSKSAKPSATGARISISPVPTSTGGKVWWIAVGS